MIELNHINKTFRTPAGEVRAVRDVSLSVGEGEIFGVIGFSGAGKSTLVRCINLLERPDSGEVKVAGQNLMLLPPPALRAARRNIGMIFQLFNLFQSRTVAGNIAYPLQHTGMAKADIERRVAELLEVVGLEAKAGAYPSQLSGGQKQRVGIARALATKPRVLLCDEATSALDPQTTRSILALLKELNRTLGLTMVIITHEMNVIKSVCTSAAVMEDGEVVERGSVFTIFSNPLRPITRDFIATTSSLHKINDLLEDNSPITNIKANQVLAKFSYVGANTVDPLISTASVLFGVKINVIFGDLDIIRDTPVGGLVNIIEGSSEAVEATIMWFGMQGVRIDIIKAGDDV